MTDPRNHKLGIYPKTKTPEIGEPLLHTVAKQIYPDGPAMVERLKAGIAELKAAENDRLIAEFLRETGNDNMAWIGESLSESSISNNRREGIAEISARADKIIDAIEVSDEAELGRIFLSAIRLYLIPAVAKAEL